MTKLAKGFRDFYQLDAWKREFLIADLNKIAKNSGFDLLLLPHVEFISTFAKAAGAMSNIVQKEFFYCYSPTNTDEPKLALRPELTTGTIRYFTEKKQLNAFQTHNVFTYGNCFRHENTQKGRYREFLQWNVEQINFSPNYIGQILNLLRSILTKLNLLEKVVIEINYLTTEQIEAVYDKFQKFKNDLPFCQLCQKRFVAKNIHRILDCSDCQVFVKRIVNLESYLNLQQKKEYDKYYQFFKLLFPKTEVIKRSSLTRGLDYYLGLVFEIKFIDAKWSKNTIIAGGSYLISAFSDAVSPNLFGCGFAIGIDRLLLAMQEMNLDYFEQFLSKLKSNIFIGVLKEKFLLNAYDLQQIIVNQGLNALVLNKVYSFNELLQYAIKKRFKWLFIFANEFDENKMIIVRKISLNPKDVFQQLLSMEEVVKFLKEQK